MNIISRQEWGARPPKAVTLEPAVVELFLHHSVGEGTTDADHDGDMGDDYMRAMQNFHMDGRGWSDIAYNFIGCPHGVVYEGRGLRVRT